MVVVLLNGTSSAGKTSIASALQRLARRPLLHLQMDTFLGMMPPRYANHADSFLFTSVGSEEAQEIVIETGAYGARLMAGMRTSIAAMAEEGLDIVVDDVLFEGDLAAYRACLTGRELRTVGVMSTLAAAEKREIARGDRMIGLARWQFDRVHQGNAYDLVVETTEQTAEACAQQIADAFDL